MSDVGTLHLLLLAALTVGAAIVFALVRLSLRLGAERARTDELLRRLELVQQSISGLTAGAVGTDRRMRRLEQREKVLAERQETYENQQIDEQPYSHAIRLVQQGAAAHRLVQELDLSESEAELIVRLHGHRESA